MSQIVDVNPEVTVASAEVLRRPWVRPEVTVWLLAASRPFLPLKRARPVSKSGHRE